MQRCSVFSVSKLTFLLLRGHQMPWAVYSFGLLRYFSRQARVRLAPHDAAASANHIALAQPSTVHWNSRSSRPGKYRFIAALNFAISGLLVWSYVSAPGSSTL